MSEKNTPAFILVENVYINLDSISYVEYNDTGNVVIVLDAEDETGKPKKVVVTPPDVDTVLEFLESHTVLKTKR